MNTYVISFDILFNNTFIGKGVDSRKAESVKDVLEAIAKEQSSDLLDQINKAQVAKGEKTFTEKNILISPTNIFKE